MDIALFRGSSRRLVAAAVLAAAFASCPAPSAADAVLAATLGGAAAQVRIIEAGAASAANTPLQVTLTRADWTYQVGDQAAFRIHLKLNPYPAGGVRVRYRLGPDMLEGAEQVATVPKEGLLLPIARQSNPGFVRCIVSATVDGRAQEATATAAFSPLALRPTQQEPADFDAYWASQQQLLAAIAPEFTLTAAPELSTPEVEVSYLKFKNVPQGMRPTSMYGVLSVPRGKGPFPAALQVPGAGVRGYKGTPQLAAKGIITLQMGIHGIPVDLPAELYEQLNIGALDNYNRYNLDNRDAYYYRRVYLGVLRALDYLAQHPKWDGRNLVAQGGSQGGQLAIMASALDARVSLTMASYPAYSDVTGYLHGRAGGWPGLFRKDADGKQLDLPLAAKVATSAYYDTVNFARRLKAPILFYAGYNDRVTPPTSTLAAFNAIRSPRSLVLDPQQVHMTSDAQRADSEQWMWEQLGKR